VSKPSQSKSRLHLQ